MSRTVLAGCLALLMLPAGCAMQSVRNAGPADLDGASAGHAVAFGRINYIVDGELKAPYGAFRPKWPAPMVFATQLESGRTFHTAAVNDEDGSFYWELPAGDYVITRIGFGQYTDDTYIAWPRLAFRIPADTRLVYLGHLRLEGTRYVEHQALSTGRTVEFHGIRYRFRVGDELEAQRAALGPQAGNMNPAKSLMFEDPDMPTGDRFAQAWRTAPKQLASRIFDKGP